MMSLWRRFKDWRTDYYPEIARFQREVVIPALTKDMTRSLQHGGVESSGPRMAYEHLRGVTIWITYHPRTFKRADLEEALATAREISQNKRAPSYLKMINSPP